MTGLPSRRFCNAVSDEPGPLPARCSRRPHETGEHDWTPSQEALAHVRLQQQALTSATLAAMGPQRRGTILTPGTGGDRLPGSRGVVRRVKARWKA